MKNSKNKLATILYVISHIALRFFQLFIVLNIITEFITTDGKYGDPNKGGEYSFGGHHSIGYTIPVNLSQNGKEVQYSETKPNQKIPIEFQKLSNSKYDKSGNLTLSVYDVIDYIPNGEMKFENLEYDYSPTDKTDINIKTSSSFINFLLGFRHYLTMFFSLIITFYITKIFKTLKNDHFFPLEISKYLNIIGLVVMLKEITRICYYYLVDKNIIELMRLRNYKIFDGISLNSIFSFTLTPFIIGLSLLFLASIFKRGYYLQQENDLTI